MKTLNNLTLQIKVTILTALLLAGLFAYMALTFGFHEFF